MKRRVTRHTPLGQAIKNPPPLPPGGYPAPPLPPGSGYKPPPPLPNDPKTYDDSFLDDESEVNDLVLSIVQDLDKNITEEEKLRVAQEKLAKILQKKAQQRYVDIIWKLLT